MGVSVRIGGRDYVGWHAVTVHRGLEEASASFSCSVSERTPGVRLEPWVLAPGAPCAILVDGELVITGYIDTYSPRFDANSHSVEVRGRPRTAAFVDAAATRPGAQSRHTTL